ncbi:MAG TPA: ATP-binding protein [Bradyrhizobium sp.]|jgi:SpoVK/Ycf46/Vps4 family AAA+-type ATPase|nr:ATP-binding protein [Bradyrhizobium sp.]
MDHFPIIQALCRAALSQPSLATRKQIERLRDALAQTGDTKSAGILAGMLTNAERTTEISPSRIVQSRAQPLGEILTPNTQLPVDRESSAPLAQLIFPSETRLSAPLFNATVTQAVGAVLEEWNNLEPLADVGVQAAKTCLIYGAPGTGKTRLALWMATQLGLPILLARIDGLVSSFLGTTARNIANLFAFANRYRCVLLLDEFDAFAKLRDDPQEVGEIKRVVNALLQNLDGRRDVGLTIGITNHPQLLDSAVWRRFEVQLEIPKPDFNMRVEIARHFVPPVVAPETHLRMIAWFTDGATGAEIETLVRTYKRAMVVQNGEERLLLDTLRQFATLNSGRIDAARKELIFSSNGVLFRTMKDDEQLGFSLEDIGRIAGKDKSTIARNIKTVDKESDDSETVSSHG